MQGGLGFGGCTLGIIQMEQSIGKPQLRLQEVRLGGERLVVGGHSSLPLPSLGQSQAQAGEYGRIVGTLLQACLIGFRGGLELTLLVESVPQLSLIVGVISSQ